MMSGSAGEPGATCVGKETIEPQSSVPGEARETAINEGYVEVGKHCDFMLISLFLRNQSTYPSAWGIRKCWGTKFELCKMSFRDPVLMIVKSTILNT